jgi:hypothetical protein
MMRHLADLPDAQPSQPASKADRDQANNRLLPPGPVSTNRSIWRSVVFVPHPVLRPVYRRSARAGTVGAGCHDNDGPVAVPGTVVHQVGNPATI